MNSLCKKVSWYLLLAYLCSLNPAPNKEEKPSLEQSAPVRFSLGYHSGTVQQNLPDPLNVVFATYRDHDDNDGDRDDQTELLLDVRILGEPTAEDLEEIIAFFEDTTHQTRILTTSFDKLNIAYLSILPVWCATEVDYGAKARKEDQEIRLFSGQINHNGELVHELTHFSLWYLEESSFAWLREWHRVAGPYDKVILEEKRGFTSAQKYKTGEVHGARLGYICPYGGKDLHEDVATYVTACLITPEVFLEVQDSFSTYYQKLELLYQANFITRPEYEKAVKYAQSAKRKLNSN